MLAAELFEQPARGRRIHVHRARWRSRSSALTNICGDSAVTGARTRFANRSRRNSCNAMPMPPPTSAVVRKSGFLCQRQAATRDDSQRTLHEQRSDAGTRPQDPAVLIKIQTSMPALPAIGSNGFYPRGKERAVFDSNPSKPSDDFRLHRAYQATGDMFGHGSAARVRVVPRSKRSGTGPL